RRLQSPDIRRLPSVEHGFIPNPFQFAAVFCCSRCTGPYPAVDGLSLLIFSSVSSAVRESVRVPECWLDRSHEPANPSACGVAIPEGAVVDVEPMRLGIIFGELNARHRRAV